MINFINPDQKTQNLLQGLKQNFFDKDNFLILSDWLEENEEIHFAQFIRNTFLKKSNNANLWQRYAGRWLGSLWKKSSYFPKLHGLLY